MTSATPKPRAGEHTPGPWQVSPEQESHGDRLCIQDSHGFIIARVPFGEPCDEANARRIVACVNACEGISTEVLERTVTAGGQSLLAEVEAECGTLRELLKWAIARVDTTHLSGSALITYQDALAKHGR